MAAIDTLLADRLVIERLQGRREQLVRQARTEAATWQQIGDALGVDRQVVWRKYHPC